MSNLNFRSPGADIRIMSSNILFDKSLPDRIGLIADYYRACGADVIGMQEVNKIGTGIFTSLAGLYTPAACEHADGKHCYTPILYRTDRFDLLESGSALYASRGTDTKSMAWVVLADKATGQKLALINSHGSLILLAYHLEATDAVEGEQWRVDNVRQMLEKKDELRARYGGIPVFITGDFNTNANGASVQAMKQSMADSAEAAVVSHTEGFNSYHKAPNQPCAAGLPIDFIFVTDDVVEVLTHHIPADEAALAISDHCPVYLDAKWK